MLPSKTSIALIVIWAVAVGIGSYWVGHISPPETQLTNQLIVLIAGMASGMVLGYYRGLID